MEGFRMVWLVTRTGAKTDEQTTKIRGEFNWSNKGWK